MSPPTEAMEALGKRDHSSWLPCPPGPRSAAGPPLMCHTGGSLSWSPVIIWLLTWGLTLQRQTENKADLPSSERGTTLAEVSATDQPLSSGNPLCSPVRSFKSRASRTSTLKQHCLHPLVHLREWGMERGAGIRWLWTGLHVGSCHSELFSRSWERGP
jgi:hypothetical protein